MAQIGIGAAMSTIGPGNRSGGHEGGTVSSHPQRVKRSLLLPKRRVVLVLEHLRAIESGCVACPAPGVLRHIAKRVRCYLSAPTTPPCAQSPAVIIPTTAADEEVCGALASHFSSLGTKCALALCELVRAQEEGPAVGRFPGLRGADRTWREWPTAMLTRPVISVDKGSAVLGVPVPVKRATAERSGALVGPSKQLHHPHCRYIAFSLSFSFGLLPASSSKHSLIG
ncbi:hypothetical protein TcBrA4_0020020 [Trypanosoma cruzi]|nr:hypothetical protein TcBrA4_0020020 [Trypanosoma cruzi]